MAVSVFDLFKIGIGPSSSHTVGPMRAGLMFVTALADEGLLPLVARLDVGLYGSLGATGRGHGTDRGVMLGLMGDAPDTVDAASIAPRLDAVQRDRQLALLGTHIIPFVPLERIAFYRQSLPAHPNALRISAFDATGTVLRETTYLSVGGGFVVTEGAANTQVLTAPLKLPHVFRSGAELLQLCSDSGRSIAELMWENERTWRDDAEIHAGLARIWDAMQDCVRQGCNGGGAADASTDPAPILTLPGPLQVRRRAPELYRGLMRREAARQAGVAGDPLAQLDWLNLFAMAVNEENAAGGRVVTAPTNGAAGIVPAVLHYYMRFIDGANVSGVETFLLTAAAIGILYKLNASISGAEVGCQGEVGVACSMAAGALVAVLGGTPRQVENAAEIGMEHNLGLTCDPVGGRVQIPCIERNAMGAVKALNAARMALQSDGDHYVSLDSVIKTMRETGADMKTKYKETSRGGLAVNIIEC
ncbi:L-serine ammonia-lyase [Robbsia andropogonis]|uniref:L-serine ammonia-lyase n=1 Tax=Robbsia andropogonis TaxID=28092 RepID=UPI0020A16E5C|nr:L-serine ammonia-lyase [Robbsia andropogonis]MCP1119061.1 L-serine ammonia-lyase [Robbsia andropogonis]MCP1128587.1 L-serine ammonia-lyase [Robbsia andropogonis]